jgi:hypothetical protein
MRAFVMKKIVFVFAAFALSAATHQAMACDWGVHAHNSSATVVSCDNNGCTAVQPSQEAAATETAAPEAPAPKTADEAGPTTVAQK